ncbi:MAG: LppX_LprAFG lipoprotein [Chloroflexota bacterium]
MIRRFPIALALVAMLAITACNSAPTGPTLTDPTAIVTAALKSTEAAKSVHLDLAVDGTATVAIPLGGGTGTPVDLSGTTAAADIDLVKPAARATFSLQAGLTLKGEAIVVDGKTYLKTPLTGPLYQVSAAGALPIDPSNTKGLIAALGDLLLKPGVVLAKGDDVACGPKRCYTVTTQLTAEQLGTATGGATAGLPVDLAGATLKLTILVEAALPYHLSGVTAVLSMPSGSALTAVVTASKWDEPVTVTAPSADQVKPAS